MDTNADTNSEMKTSPKRPTVVTIAAILLIILTLFVAGFGLASQFGLIRGATFGGRQFTPGQFRGGNFAPPGGFVGNVPGSNGFQGGNDANGLQGNGNGTNGLPGGGSGNNGTLNGQTGQGTTRTFTGNRAGVAGLARILRTLRPIILGLTILLLILAIVAVIGLFMNKRWGSILAIVISALVILLTIPSMIRIFSTVTLVENLVRILMAVAVIVLLLLPAARKSYALSATSAEEETERIVR